jgi:formate dehydrogenase subunit gamma
MEKQLKTKEGYIYVTTTFERWVHWWLALTCIYLFFTGLGFMFHSFSFVPTIIGGHLIPKYAHNYAGILYFISSLCALSVWYKDAGKFHDYDWEWMKKGGGYLKPMQDVPPSGKYNAGQKLFFWIAVTSGFYMFGTGVIMWFPLGFPPGLVRFCYLLHASGAVIMGAGIVMHGFLGTFANYGSVSAMMHGWVSKEWIRTQHGRWYKELKERGVVQ